MSKNVRWITLLWILAFCSIAAAQSPLVRPEAIVDQDSRWSGPPFVVRVCWESTNDFSQERRWVEESVYAYLEGVNREVSGLRFLNLAGGRGNWSACEPKSTGIRITVEDSRSRSDVGRQWNRDANGNKLSERPTRMYLNFSFEASPSDAWCRQQREHCIRAIAVHEFMHAVGFLHEQLRNDAPPECKAAWAKEPDFKGYKPLPVTVSYDAESHMNYCTDMYRKPIRLSQLDAEALLWFYPID